MPPKRFNKKNAITFELVRRSQKDPLISDETKNQYVLRPVLKPGQNLPKDFMLPYQEERHAIPKEVIDADYQPDPEYEPSDYGLPEDGYDYSRHLKNIGGGHFVDAPPEPKKAPANSLLKIIKDLPEDLFASKVEEEVGMLDRDESDVFRLDLDLEVMAALDGGEEYEELNDDFVMMANREPLPGEEFEDEDEWDDPWVDNVASISSRPGQMSMAGSRRTKKSVIDLDALSSISAMSRGPAHEVTEQKFEDAIGEWEIGELDGEDPSVQGMHDISAFAHIIDDFLEDRKFDRQQPPEPEDSERAITLKLAEGQLDGPAELEELQEASSSDGWDAETITSTYTTSDNHPALLDDAPPRLKKIAISDKTGIPLGVLPNQGVRKVRVPKADTSQAVVGSETAEEKRERKKAARQQKSARREAKKEMKELYKEERIRQVTTNVQQKKTGNAPNASVIKYL